MPIEGPDRVATEAERAGHGATTPSGGTPRRSRLRSRDGRVEWCAFSAALADLRVRVLTAEIKAANLEVALATNRRIGIAVGILMCRLGVTEDRAMAVLSKHSQDHNVKVRTMAEEVIYTGSL